MEQDWNKYFLFLNILYNYKLNFLPVLIHFKVLLIQVQNINLLK